MKKAIKAIIQHVAVQTCFFFTKASHPMHMYLCMKLPLILPLNNKQDDLKSVKICVSEHIPKTLSISVV